MTYQLHQILKHWHRKAGLGRWFRPQGSEMPFWGLNQMNCRKDQRIERDQCETGSPSEKIRDEMTLLPGRGWWWNHVKATEQKWLHASFPYTHVRTRTLSYTERRSCANTLRRFREKLSCACYKFTPRSDSAWKRCASSTALYHHHVQEDQPLPRARAAPWGRGYRWEAGLHRKAGNGAKWEKQNKTNNANNKLSSIIQGSEMRHNK